MFDSVIDNLVKKPRKLFVIDGLGALLSAFLLGVVLVQLKHLIGVPSQTLYILASIPVLFAVYDLVCFYRWREGHSKYLKYIAFANILYCVFSIVMMINHAHSLTALGWTYFIIEILIVLAIALIELKSHWQIKTN